MLLYQRVPAEVHMMLQNQKIPEDKVEETYIKSYVIISLNSVAYFPHFFLEVFVSLYILHLPLPPKKGNPNNKTPPPKPAI